MQSFHDIVNKKPSKVIERAGYEWCPFRKGYFNESGERAPWDRVEELTQTYDPE